MMSAVLQVVRDRLRAAVPLAAEECALVPGGQPPENAGELFVAVDEVGVTSAARECLVETYEIEVAIWRRVGQFPTDRLGDLALAVEPAMPGVATLDALERSVVRLLHANVGPVTAAANALIEACTPGHGDVFQLALYYAGRGRTERLGENDAPPSWLGRRLKFAGLMRVQALDVMT